MTASQANNPLLSEEPQPQPTNVEVHAPTPKSNPIKSPMVIKSFERKANQRRARKLISTADNSFGSKRLRKTPLIKFYKKMMQK